MGSVPGLGRSPGEGHGNPLQYSCLENPVDQGAWWTTVHRAAKSWAQLNQLSVHTHTHRGNAEHHPPHPATHKQLDRSEGERA